VFSHQYAAAVCVQLLLAPQSAALKFLQDQSRTEVRAFPWQHAALEGQIAAAAEQCPRKTIMCGTGTAVTAVFTYSLPAAAI
jgi:hypothetical protein